MADGKELIIPAARTEATQRLRRIASDQGSDGTHRLGSPETVQMKGSGLMCSERSKDQRERVVRVLSVAAFLIFFQANMIAPLIPRLSITFGVSDQAIGLLIPVYMIPYGIAALF